MHALCMSLSGLSPETWVCTWILEGCLPFVLLLAGADSLICLSHICKYIPCLRTFFRDECGKCFDMLHTCSHTVVLACVSSLAGAITGLISKVLASAGLCPDQMPLLTECYDIHRSLIPQFLCFPPPKSPAPFLWMSVESTHPPRTSQTFRNMSRLKCTVTPWRGVNCLHVSKGGRAMDGIPSTLRGTRCWLNVGWLVSVGLCPASVGWMVVGRCQLDVVSPWCMVSFPARPSHNEPLRHRKPRSRKLHTLAY